MAPVPVAVARSVAEKAELYRCSVEITDGEISSSCGDGNSVRWCSGVIRIYASRDGCLIYVRPTSDVEVDVTFACSQAPSGDSAKATADAADSDRAFCSSSGAIEVDVTGR